ncbi:ABC transporter permease [Marinomonas flavescens]|uniref:ABC transporter permease n=1 Tax=Marinomonas flavescens TaxID=2529379 RepID=UPI001055CC5E|nr:ABC transporter permease [Marinomonas flavescens]
MFHLSIVERIKKKGTDALELYSIIIFLIVSILFFSLISSDFFSLRVFQSMAFQLPELGLLTLAMLIPIISGGLNLSITFSANICGLSTAFLIKSYLPDFGVLTVFLAFTVGIVVGIFVGALIGLIIAYVGAHPILVTLGAMIFLRGLGETITHGGDISGMPEVFNTIGNSLMLGIPIPLYIFLAASVVTFYIMQYTKIGFSIYMVGSNPDAASYSGINTKHILVFVYSLSGALAGLAGVLMLSRFNSVRIGHGYSYLLITILACFLAGANPFGGFGRIIPLVIGLISLQVIASGMNLMGASQYLVTAMWGGFLIIVMMLRSPFLKKN